MTDLASWMKDQKQNGSSNSSNSNTSRLDTALELASRGWPVFPCHLNKKPAVKWKVGATTDEGKIREWFGNGAQRLIGVKTGAKSGLAVLDIDVNKDVKNPLDGFESLREAGLDPPMTQANRTRRGGAHYLYSYREGIKNSVSKIGKGIDVRADGGFIIWWPAEGLGIEHEGRRGEPPTWLNWRELKDGQKKAGNLEGLTGNLSEIPACDHYADRAFDSAVSNIIGAPGGTRNETLNKEAHGLYGLALAGRLDEATVTDALRRAAAGAGLGEAETERTLQSAREGATARPAEEQTEKREALAIIPTEKAQEWDEAQKPGHLQAWADEPDGWRVKPIPVPGLQALSEWMQGAGVGAIAATAGALIVGSTLAARRWTTADGDGVNIWQGVVCDDMAEGRRMIELCEIALRAAGAAELIHQERIEGHVQVRRALYNAPACLFTADFLGGLAAGGQSAIRRKGEQAHSDLVRFGYLGRAIMLSPDGLQSILGPGKENARRATIVAPSASVITAVSPRSIPLVYRSEALGSGNIEPYMMAWTGGACRSVAATEPLPDVLDAMAAIAGDGDIETLFDRCPENLGPVRSARAMGTMPTEEDVSLLTEQAGGDVAPWRVGMEAHALRNMHRVIGLLGACSQGGGGAGMIGQDGIDWAMDWCSHWFFRTVTEIMRVGGASDGRLTLLEAIEAFVAARPGVGASNRDLTVGCKAYRKATKKEREDAIATLVADGRLGADKRGRAVKYRIVLANLQP